MHKMNIYTFLLLIAFYKMRVLWSFYTTQEGVFILFCTEIMKNKKFFKKG